MVSAAGQGRCGFLGATFSRVTGCSTKRRVPVRMARKSSLVGQTDHDLDNLDDVCVARYEMMRKRRIIPWSHPANNVRSENPCGE